LICFIFIGNTYVIPFILACLMIIAELTVGARILLEKGPSRHHTSEDQKFPAKIEKIVFFQMTEEARREAEMGHGGSEPPLGTGPPQAAPRHGVGTLTHF
jgi:hypothetical protein